MPIYRISNTYTFSPEMSRSTIRLLLDIKQTLKCQNLVNQTKYLNGVNWQHKISNPNIWTSTTCMNRSLEPHIHGAQSLSLWRYQIHSCEQSRSWRRLIAMLLFHLWPSLLSFPNQNSTYNSYMHHAEATYTIFFLLNSVMTSGVLSLLGAKSSPPYLFSHTLSLHSWRWQNNFIWGIWCRSCIQCFTAGFYLWNRFRLTIFFFYWWAAE
jgi:hypothetical protein